MSNKGRQPDLIINCVVDERGFERWIEIGRLWAGKNGTYSGDPLSVVPVTGRIVLVPPKPREDKPDGSPASDDQGGPTY